MVGRVPGVGKAREARAVAVRAAAWPKAEAASHQQRRRGVETDVCQAWDNLLKRE